MRSVVLTRRHALFVCAFVALTALTCAGLLGAAALVPAPPVVVPLLVPVCLACPMLAAWELPAAVAVLRSPAAPEVEPLDHRVLARLRAELAALPETAHPLDD